MHEIKICRNGSKIVTNFGLLDAKDDMFRNIYMDSI